MNVLLTSAGRRVELLRVLETDLQDLTEGSVIVADASPDAPCMHLAAGAALLPRLTEPGFESALLEVIAEHQIGLVIPTIDTELPVLASMRGAIEVAGARLLISGAQTIAVAADKVLTEQFLTTHAIPHPNQWSAEEAAELAPDLPYPVFIKPRGGSASIGVVLARHEQQLRALLGPEDIVQEVAAGDEFTVDVWVDESGELRSCIARRRIAVRGGEVEKGVTQRHAAVLDVAAAVARNLPDAFGPLNVQVFADDEDVRVIEINARYGGGFPLSWAAGARTTRWALQFGLGHAPEPSELEWRAGIRMLRYDQSVFLGR
jgi:carbamoyl-phosphate synthase large subunit